MLAVSEAVDSPPTVSALAALVAVKFSVLNGMLSDRLVAGTVAMLIDCGPFEGMVMGPRLASCGWKTSKGGAPIGVGKGVPAATVTAAPVAGSLSLVT